MFEREIIRYNALLNEYREAIEGKTKEESGKSARK